MKNSSNISPITSSFYDRTPLPSSPPMLDSDLFTPKNGPPGSGLPYVIIDTIAIIDMALDIVGDVRGDIRYFPPAKAKANQ